MECKSAVSPSRLPGLDWALNPYRGCGHACAYCYAQDVTRFESGKAWGEVVEVKVNIVSRLKKDLEKGTSGVYGLGTVTDPYQPIEKEYELTRGCLKLLKRSRAKVSVLTKSDLVTRDLDLLRDWPEAEVGISIGCTDDALAAKIEAGASMPSERFKALSVLAGSGVDVYLMAAPIIPGLTDSEQMLADLVRAAAESGTKRVMWDKYNSKPMAGSRLRKALEDVGLPSISANDPGAHTRIRSILVRECSVRGLRLLDAF